MISPVADPVEPGPSKQNTIGSGNIIGHRNGVFIHNHIEWATSFNGMDDLEFRAIII
jgi:hypothetical protein